MPGDDCYLHHHHWNNYRNNTILGTMNDKEFMERMKRAKSKVKDGLFTPIVDMIPEDREYASVKQLDKEL